LNVWPNLGFDLSLIHLQEISAPLSYDPVHYKDGILKTLRSESGEMDVSEVGVGSH
jgi:hypothetical protein